MVDAGCFITQAGDKEFNILGLKIKIGPNDRDILCIILTLKNLIAGLT